MKKEDRNYYTPDIEDLFRGYECEYRSKSYSGKDKVEWYPWKEIVVTNDFMARGYSESYFDSDIEIRTPYLSKEDIEKEGWKEDKDFGFVKEGYFMSYLPLNHELRVYLFAPLSIFQGTCKSINEFRKIMKWLEIC